MSATGQLTGMVVKHVERAYPIFDEWLEGRDEPAGVVDIEAAWATNRGQSVVFVNGAACVSPGESLDEYYARMKRERERA